MGTGRKLSNRVSLFTFALAIGLTVAPSANADRRGGAPITFAGQGANATQMRAAPAQRQYTAAPSSQRSENARTKRIEFRYPDNPNIVYDQNGAHQVADAAPMAFSSAQSAIAPSQARQYAKAEDPQMLVPQPRLDPAISRGGFDARATAARVEAASATALPAARTAPAYESGAMGQGGATEVAYAPVGDTSYDESGVVSWYGEDFHGQPTANGEIFDMEGMTAAHPNLPLPSLVQVINLDNGREVVVRVNDRGPFVEGRIMDVSARAANVLGFHAAGQANVKVKYLGPAPVIPTQTVAQPQMQVQMPTPRGPTQIARVASPKMSPIPNPTAYGTYFVQLGSFADIGNAQRLVADIGSGIPVDIVAVNVRGSDFFRVLVGPLGERATADGVRDQLSLAGIADGMVITKDR